MKLLNTVVILLVLSLFMLPGTSKFLYAQDYMDVEPGYETLNLAVEGDTLANGDPASLDRVYRLERGGLYLFNGTIRGNGAPLRIVAAAGEGPKPLLISTADESGESSRYFRPGVDGEWRDLYISGIDNLGNQVGKNCFRVGKEGGRYIVDNCVVDGDAQNFFRIDAQDQKVFITNSELKNSYLLSDPANGRFMDTRGNTTDTLFVQNNTLINCSADFLRNGGGIIKNFIFDHNTSFLGIGRGSEFEMDRNIYNQVTNNLFMNPGWEGRDLFEVDSTNECLIPADSLNAPEMATEEERDWKVTNNVKGWDEGIRNWVASKDSMQLYPWTDYQAQVFFETMDNFVFENNIIEDVVFSDGPELTHHLAFMEHRYNDDYANNGNPEIRLDRNGVASFENDPELNTFGPADDEYDFDYANTFAAYTHAEGDFPVGDLNWFPDKKAEWEQWVATSIPVAGDIRPTEFALSQNYPNPFNPTTTIAYDIAKQGAVNLVVYNMLGQKVRTLVDSKQAPGAYRITWDGRDDNGALLPTGMYVYRLESSGLYKAHKMLLLK